MDTGSGNGAVVEGSIVKMESMAMESVGTLMRRATDVAGVCREIVTKTAQAIPGSDRKHVKVEGWQSIAAAYGLVASSRDVETVYENGKAVGIRAIGELRRISDGQLLATAEGFVGEDEPLWAGGGLNKKTGKPYDRRPDYARRAMAQTRAISRVCRGPLAFVVTLIDSGLSTTPYEEMDGVEHGSVEQTAPSNGKTLAEKMREGPQMPPAPPPPASPPRQSAENSGAKPTHDRNVSFRFGRSANTPLHSLAEGDLKFYEGALQRDIASDDPKKTQYRQANSLALANVQAEMRFRGIN